MNRPEKARVSSWRGTKLSARSVSLAVIEKASLVNPFMQRAIELSLENVRANAGGPFAAVVVKDGAIVATGINQVTATLDPTAHAEIVAIREACEKLRRFELSGYDLFTTCEPCPMCMGAIYWARLEKVYYANTRGDAAKIGFDDSLIYEELALPIARRKIPMEQIMRDEALSAFREWERSQTKTRY